MNRRYVVTSLSIVAVVALVPLSATGQGVSGWTAPKTPWGDPALMGTYTNKTITPVQRPDDLADREFLTVEESAALERERVERNDRLLHAPAEKTTAGGNVGSCQERVYGHIK